MLSIERDFLRTTRPLYSHLVSLLENAIARGELPSGPAVPGGRQGPRPRPPIERLHAPRSRAVLVRLASALARRRRARPRPVSQQGISRGDDLRPGPTCD